MSNTPHNLTLILSEAIQKNAFDKVFLAVENLHPIDLADALKPLMPALSWRLLEQLPNRAEVFGCLDMQQQLAIAQEFPRITLAELVSELPSDKRTDLFKNFSQSQRDQLLPVLATSEREAILKLMVYEEGTAGALMTTDFVQLNEEMTTAEAVNLLRDTSLSAETIYQVYVTDEHNKLLGVVSLRDLVSADIDKLIQDLMVTDFISAEVMLDQEHIGKLIVRYDLLALPITNEQGILLGIVTHDDAMDVVNQEVTEDIHKSAGVTSIPVNLKSASIALLYKKRIFWLLLLVFGNLFSGLGIAHFEDIIAANIVLVFFLPLLVDSGGNAGSQSATLMVRALATGEVVMKDWLYLIGREALVALALGGSMAVAVSLLGFLRGDETIALVLALSMVSIVLIGCMIGMSLPFLLSRFKLDPASASAPLITSVCDAVGVVIYLYIAAQLLDSVTL